jgi:hypothetical protein
MHDKLTPPGTFGDHKDKPKDAEAPGYYRQSEASRAAHHPNDRDRQG